jgi:hypothetical protein
MTIVGIVLTILAFALIGFLVHLIITNIPMPDPFKSTIIVVCVVLIILYLLALIGNQAGLVSVPHLTLK